MRVAILLAVVACAAPRARDPLSNAGAPARETIAIDFATATRAFHEHWVQHDGDPLARLDDRECPVVGPPWTEAEDAALAALARDIPRVNVLSMWRGETMSS